MFRILGAIPTGFATDWEQTHLTETPQWVDAEKVRARAGWKTFKNGWGPWK